MSKLSVLFLLKICLSILGSSEDWGCLLHRPTSKVLGQCRNSAVCACHAVPGHQGRSEMRETPPPPTTAGAGRVSRGPGCLTQTSQGLTEKEGASSRLQEWGLGLWEPSVEVAGCEGKLQVET